MKLFDNLRMLRTLTPEMRLAMRNVRPADAKQNRLLVELQRQTEYLSKKDVGLWRAAWQQAINVQNPNRCALYDIYTDVAIDLHLTGCISQRKGFVLKSQYKLTDSAGKRDDRATEILNSEWFSDFINLVLDSRFYGHSLIQLGERINTPLGTPRFDNVLLVPRKHVIPEYGVIVRNCHDTPQSGVSYRTGDIAMQCVEAGKPDDLGLLLKCAPSALSKKNMLAFWDGFGEIFGMPIRIAKTTSNDEKYRSQIERMLARMGAAFYGVFQEATEIEIKESSRGDAFNVYDKRIDKANAEISKGILNQTMTIDSGSSLSQSEVHLKVFENIIEADRRFVADIVNDRLLPLMVRHGFKVDKLRFEWDDTEEYTPEDIRSVEQMLVTGGYDIDPKYFVDKYGIPVTGRRQDAPTLGRRHQFFRLSPPQPRATTLDRLYFEGDKTLFKECINTFRQAVDYTLASKSAEQAIIDDIVGSDRAVNAALYQTYANNLRRAIDRVFAQDDGSGLSDRLRANVSRFAAYKAYHATRLARQAAAEPDGDPRRVLHTFNRYQAAEYNTTVSRSRTAKQWGEFADADHLRLFPNLRWLPSRSATPREEHVRFYNRVWAKTDPFWQQNQPGNLWNCKCDWEETDDPCTTANPTTPIRHNGLEGNPALTGQVFTDNHAYFAKCSKTQQKKLTHYIGDKILRNESKQSLRKIQGSTVVIDKQGEKIEVLFDSKTTSHLSNDIARDAKFLWNELLRETPKVLKKSKLVAHEMNTKKSDKPSAVEYFYYEYKIKGDSLYFSVEENFVEYEDRHFYRLYAVSGTLRNSVVFYK